ncbi:MAG: hypothetical protein A2041_00400 [Bacteroidetes bacterium GWA2_31_9b]|nr:MAG: hypothetical protein A2041_00400 [Bacteroidetes bacterium GWA2_31_9b]
MLLIIAFLISLIGTYFVRRLALKNKVVDIPNERSSHTRPTPRGGGLAIIVAFYVGLFFIFYLKLIDKNLFFALLSGFPLIIVSIIDDLKDVSPKIRIFIQFISSFLVIYFIGGIQIIDLGFYAFTNKYILLPISLIGILWFINLYNFLDGIDGYASIEAIFIALAIFLFTDNIESLLLIFSVIGFLFWNWPKAKIFMGDVGSTMLGFILIVLGIYYNNTLQFSFIHWLIISSLFWFDATITLFRRILNKETLSIAHKKHAYQRIVLSGFSHQKTLIYSILINIIILGLTFVCALLPKYILIFFTLNIIFLYGIIKIIDKKYPFN